MTKYLKKTNCMNANAGVSMRLKYIQKHSRANWNDNKTANNIMSHRYIYIHHRSYIRDYGNIDHQHTHTHIHF